MVLQDSDLHRLQFHRTIVHQSGQDNLISVGVLDTDSERYCASETCCSEFEIHHPDCILVKHCSNLAEGI